MKYKNKLIGVLTLFMAVLSLGLLVNQKVYAQENNITITYEKNGEQISENVAMLSVTKNTNESDFLVFKDNKTIKTKSLLISINEDSIIYGTAFSMPTKKLKKGDLLNLGLVDNNVELKINGVINLDYRTSAAGIFFKIDLAKTFKTYQTNISADNLYQVRNNQLSMSNENINYLTYQFRLKKDYLIDNPSLFFSTANMRYLDNDYSESFENLRFEYENNIIEVFINDKLTDTLEYTSTNQQFVYRLDIYPSNIRRIKITELDGTKPAYYLEETGKKILTEKIVNYKQNELGNHEYYEHYYQDNRVVLDTDLVTSDLELKRKLKFVDNPEIILTFESNIGNVIPDYIINPLDYNMGPKDYFSFNKYNIEIPTMPLDTNYIFSHFEIDNQKIDLKNYRFRSDTIINVIYKPVGEPISVVFGRSHSDNQFFIKDGKKVNTITFEFKTGDVIDISKLNLPDYYKYDYNFIAWDFDFSKPLSESVYIDAIFEKRAGFNISFDTNGGVSLPDLILENSYYNNLIYPTPVKHNNLFLGWFIDKELLIPAKTNLNTSDVEYYNTKLYASWLYNGARIYFETNAADLPYQLSPLIVTKGTNLNISNPPKRYGYIFDGWFLDKELTNNYQGEPIYEDEITLYAKWEIDPNAAPIIPDEPVDNNYEIILISVIVIGSVILLAAIFTPKKKGRRRR